MQCCSWLLILPENPLYPFSLFHLTSVHTLITRMYRFGAKYHHSGQSMQILSILGGNHVSFRLNSLIIIIRIMNLENWVQALSKSNLLVGFMWDPGLLISDWWLRRLCYDLKHDFHLSACFLTASTLLSITQCTYCALPCHLPGEWSSKESSFFNGLRGWGANGNQPLYQVLGITWEGLGFTQILACFKGVGVLFWTCNARKRGLIYEGLHQNHLI